MGNKPQPFLGKRLQTMSFIFPSVPQFLNSTGHCSLISFLFQVEIESVSKWA